LCLLLQSLLYLLVVTATNYIPPKSSSRLHVLPFLPKAAIMDSAGDPGSLARSRTPLAPVGEQHVEPAATAPPGDDPDQYPHGMKLVLLMSSLFLGAFLASLVGGERPR
jgi:hypothetical protein